MDSVALTLGPILFGGAVALMLSGAVAVQCIIFFKLYPDEGRIKTTMVATVWTLDAAQSCFILASLSDYFIAHFGDRTATRQNVIPWSIAVCINVASFTISIDGQRKLTILVTAMQTCVVHLFYAQSIYRSSGNNWWLTGPIVGLASLRLLAAIVATIEMLHLGRWDAFSRPYPRLLFTTGLSLSAATDAIITACLCYYLRKIRKLSSSTVMQGVFDTLTLYTLENGLITCLTTIGSLTFWLALPASSISLSLHFIIGKLYPNSLLILLNTRKGLREIHAGDQGIHFDPSDHLANYFTHFPHRAAGHYFNHSAFMTAPPPPVHGYRPAFKMHQIEVTQRGGDCASMAESEFEKRAAPRSMGNTSLNWRALP